MAKKFQFRPEVILKLREQREQLARRKLADAQGAVIEMERKIRDLRGQMDQQNTLVRAGVLLGKVDVQFMSHYRRHSMSLHRLMIQHAQSLQQASAQLQQVRNEALVAIKERKVMTKLKENLLAKHQAGLEYEERRELDEMTTMRFGNSMAQGSLGQAE
jgi:flagellar export protein FliJ